MRRRPRAQVPGRRQDGIDQAGAVASSAALPIHRSAPPFDDLTTETELFEQICAGETLTAVTRIADLKVRESGKLGKMADANPANNDQGRGEFRAGDRTRYNGGDLQGLRARIADGTFDRLGVRALWISPFHRNPDGPWPGTNGTQITATLKTLLPAASA